MVIARIAVESSQRPLAPPFVAEGAEHIAQSVFVAHPPFVAGAGLASLLLLLA
jgi:hypothetical protein